jgi:nicotinamidase-related amidase
MKHVWDAPDAAFMRPGTDGIEIHPLVEPADGELVLEKATPNSFVGTPLESELRERDPEQLVVAGMMSSMCVDATVRAAADLGFSPTVVHDACAAPDLAFNGVDVSGAAVHAAFMAALADGYAEVTSATELLEDAS